MSDKLLIKNGIIVTSNKTIYNQSILIEDKKIIQMDTGIEDDEAVVIDATDCYIVPGLIDLHCNIQDPGFDYKETMLTVGQSAINGGFTTLTINPNTVPRIDNKAIVEYIISKAKNECPVQVVPYGNLTRNGEGKVMSEIGEMQLAGIAAVSDGDHAIQDTDLMRNLCNYCSMFDIPVIAHCENRLISNGNEINEGAISTYLGIQGAPITAETIHLARNILLANEFGTKLHITHVSTAQSVEMIRQFKKQGFKLTCETSPQYFTLNEEAAMGYNTLVKVNPPLRTAADVEAIIKGLRDGIIDTISSDHCPDTIDSKEVEYTLASFGISSLETAFSLSYTYLVEQGHLNMEQLIDKMSHKPAQILTLNKGTIQVGSTADLTIFNPNEDYYIDASKFKSKARYSPYDGLVIKGRVKYTLVNGKLYRTDG
ncbi:dihydroorotase [Vallitaleaceae bacterium 9-2]